MQSSRAVGGLLAASLVAVSITAIRLPHETVVQAAGQGGGSGAASGEDVVDPLVGPGAGEGTGPVGGGGAGPVTSGGPSTASRARAGLACAAGQNGGATAPGVSGTKISLASTVVLSGIGASFLADSAKAMQAVVTKVNRSGGICGRTLDLTVRDDRWDPGLGHQFLNNFIASKQYFAFPVVPSSEGLTAAIKAGDISRGGVPVVGSDGMLIEQYKDPWVWPVATATVSTMRVMAKYGYDQGARTFGIVYDSQYKFGVEGAAAFEKFVKTLPGASIAASQGIRPGQSSYGSEVQKFNDGCKPACDMVAMLLEPTTAETWIAGRPTRGKLVTAGAQTLFNRRFAQNCRIACQDMVVWTGYNPPIDTLATLPGVAEYVNDLKAVDPGVDTTNAFAQGAYLGMSTFVEALRRVGPDLTRERLREELNRMDFKTDLSSQLSWRVNQRNANTRAQAFSLQYAGDDFSGFRNEQTGWIADPQLGG